MRCIATTTINPPSDALKKFATRENWTLISAGDKKTPTDWHIPNAIYISPKEQESYDKQLSDAIGWNTMARRNFALLYAHDLGAEVVGVVDDDNEPLENWGQDVMVGRKVEVNYYTTDAPAFDPVGAAGYRHLWHRGFPLELISTRDYSKVKKKFIVPDVDAGFWNGNPDIDAICRLEHAPECKFQDKYFPIASNKFSPFNSQNTFISGSLLKDYFLAPGIGRMDDIFASYYLQAKGAKVVYSKPSVYQRRNPHNLIEDMKAEYLGYENNLAIVKALATYSEAVLDYLPKRALEAFVYYRKHF